MTFAVGIVLTFLGLLLYLLATESNRGSAARKTGHLSTPSAPHALHRIG